MSLCEVEFKNTVLKSVKKHHGGMIHSSSDYAVVIARFWQTISEILPTITLRKPAFGTWGYCKHFLCPWSYDFLGLCEAECKNTVLGPVKEHHGDTVNSSSDYVVVISRLWQTMSEILPTSTLKKPALGTWGYCKPFLCLWSCDFLRLCEVVCKNTVLGPVKEYHEGRVNSF